MKTPKLNIPVINDRQSLLELTPSELRDWLAAHQEPAMRAKQIRSWLIAKGVEDFDEMTDLPKSLRQLLVESFALYSTREIRRLIAKDDTHKLLLALSDERLIECVLIQEANRRTACISTQVGCGMGCVFCASGIGGVERNLSVSEILEQLIRLRNLPLPTRLTHIVVMGMGEPLANLDHLLKALAVATAKDGLGLSARHITISTVGLPNRIRQLAESGNHYHLAVSLHAPNDSLRSEIVPTNDKSGIADILDAADFYLEKTGRQVTYEYVLLGGVNDRETHARELAYLLRKKRAHVNLIPFNNVQGLPYVRPDQSALTVFVDTLRSVGVSVKVRKRKGSEIDAACGQLRRKTETRN